ncbi:MAG: hypothetical protein GX275_00570 [Clostridiales bacterium]|nr:hypothetical protein [Clostridiales bacterium]
MKYEILSDLASKLGLNYNENNNLLFGIYNSYNISIELDEDLLCLVKIPVKLTENYNIKTLNSFILSIKENTVCVLEGTYKDNTLEILFSPQNSDSSVIYEIINKIIGEFSQNLVSSCCSCCGECVYSSLQSFKGSNDFMCFDCRQKVFLENTIDTKNIYKEEHKYVITPIIGSILAALVGVGITIPLHIAHYVVASIGSIAIAYFALKGYTAFGGELKLRGKVLSFVVTLVMISLSFYIGQGFKELVFSNTGGSSINLILESMYNLYKTNSEFRNENLSHLLIVYLISIPILIPIFKSTTSRITFTKVENANA